MNPRIRLTSAKVWVGVEVEAEVSFILTLHQISSGVAQISSGTTQISSGAAQISSGTAGKVLKLILINSIWLYA